jgi:hypothetical protein
LRTFYIKPADGKELPDIMQWMMNFVHLADVLGTVQRDYGKDGARVGRTSRRFSRGIRLWRRKRWTGRWWRRRPKQRSRRT